MGMSVSLKKETKKTNIKHNNREMGDKEKGRNSHIDYSRSHENKYLVQKDIKKLYEREFGDALEKYNAKQKRSDRKIDNYYKHIQSGKKTSLQQEMIIQVGDKDDFSSEGNYKLANDILEEWFEGFEKRNPNLKVYNAVIHNDEASPHMHLNFVPVADGYKRGLEKQVAFDRAIKQQNSTLNNTRPFEDWREKEVQLLGEMLKERGIDRKLVGTNEYQDVTEYKQKKDELRFIEKEIKKKENDLDRLTDALNPQFIQVDGREKVIEVIQEKKKIPFGNAYDKAKIIEKETGNYIITADKYEKIKRQLTASAAVHKVNKELRSTDFFKENQILKVELQKTEKENKELLQKQNQLFEKNEDLRQANGKLKNRNYLLEKENFSLKLEIKSIVEATKDHFKLFSDDLKGNMCSWFNLAKNSIYERFRGNVGVEDFEIHLEKVMAEDQVKNKKINKNRNQDFER